MGFAICSLVIGTLSVATTAVSVQPPVGSLAGTITDALAVAVADAKVSLQQSGGSGTRSTISQVDGRYRFEYLAPGDYDLEVRAPGFRISHRSIVIRIGDALTLDIRLEPGGPDERIDVVGQSTPLNRTEYRIGSSVERIQIEQLPLNGRGFLQLAELQPAVEVVSVTNPGGLGNNFQRALVAGAYYSQTRISVDGSTVGDRLTGGTMQNFSQESVQEFQVATFNLDPATSVGASGAVNIVTRRGTDRFSGAAFLAYRDNDLAAYPALRRGAVDASPFFARRQAGGSAGGPLVRTRLFWFANYERNNQDGVFAVTNNHPIFSKFDGVFPNPLVSDQYNLRVDGRLDERHQGVMRVSVERNDSTSPAVATGMPSNWQSVRNRATQVQAGVVSILSSKAVNDLRASFGYLGGDLDPISAENCPDPVSCVGAGGPNVLVFDAPAFRIGQQTNSPFARWQRVFQVVNTVTWERGSHRLRAGAEWEHSYLKASLAFLEPATIVLWGPSNLQAPGLQSLRDTLPVSVTDPAAPPPTLAEIMRLPLRSFSTGIGNPSLPGPYNFDSASRNNRFRAHVQDAWRARPNLTISYGLSYAYDTNLFAHDLDYPAYLAPLIGTDLGPPRRDANNFDPSLGFAWSPGDNGRTVFRGGSGVYHDEATFFWKARERAFLGPSGNGRVAVDGSVSAFNFLSTPTDFTGGQLLPLLPAIRAELAGRFGDGTDLAVRGIEVVKQGDQLVAPDSTTAYSIHASAGVQRELMPGLVVSADYVMRRYVHVGPLQGVYAIDRNRFNRPRVTGVDTNTGVVSFVRDPIIPLCSPSQAVALDPSDVCSTGPINVFSSGANARYQGLHLRMDKRYSSGWQFTAGYALSRHVGFVEGGFTSYDDYSLAYGNIPGTRRHRLTLSGVWTLPNYRGNSLWGKALLNDWSVAFISQTHSAPPLNTLLNGLDLDGDGISATLLPGTRHNSLGQGLTPARLRNLVEDYNAQVEALTRTVVNDDGSTSLVPPRTPFNQIISPLVLPDTFASGDTLLTQDVRVTRTLGLPAGLRLALIAEVFNVFNFANLAGYSGVLNQPNYGQASSRVGQVFGTGGPRAFQFGARVRF
ncbi:MAG TPA: carboxypeptidase regulatory-like domain-containing protein [Nitrospiraceae bacterium]|nr:carboxypeptidase regulatory-like domain-containing protein [Nitrospiraceae bacterium]